MLTLAMHTEDAAQYSPRLQSPPAKQARADPRLQKKRITGKIRRLSNRIMCFQTPEKCEEGRELAFASFP
jgi:hypothetical protein